MLPNRPGVFDTHDPDRRRGRLDPSTQRLQGKDGGFAGVVLFLLAFSLTRRSAPLIPSSTRRYKAMLTLGINLC